MSAGREGPRSAVYSTRDGGGGKTAVTGDFVAGAGVPAVSTTETDCLPLSEHPHHPLSDSLSTCLIFI